MPQTWKTNVSGAKSLCLSSNVGALPVLLGLYIIPGWTEFEGAAWFRGESQWWQTNAPVRHVAQLAGLRLHTLKDKSKWPLMALHVQSYIIRTFQNHSIRNLLFLSGCYITGEVTGARCLIMQPI